MVQASRDKACHAVEMYNRPGAPRSYETFVVHMHLAWLYLLQAEAHRAGTDYRYIEMRGSRRRIIRVDGEPKTWELDRHVVERWPDQNEPVRANLRFFVALRNKIEHRFTRSQAALAIATGGHAHALLVNYEAELTSQFGAEASLAHRLRFPVFVGSFTEDGEALLRRMRESLPATLRRFLTHYHDDLDPQVRADSRFEFRHRDHPYYPWHRAYEPDRYEPAIVMLLTDDELRRAIFPGTTASWPRCCAILNNSAGVSLFASTAGGRTWHRSSGASSIATRHALAGAATAGQIVRRRLPIFVAHTQHCVGGRQGDDRTGDDAVRPKRSSSVTSCASRRSGLFQDYLLRANACPLCRGSERRTVPVGKGTLQQ